MKIKQYFGTKTFYKTIFAIMLPVLLQTVVTNFVNLLDNIMVGQVGTEPMSGVAIVNQLFFVFMLCVFGGLAGVGIYTSQFYGKGDIEGLRHTTRLKLYVAIISVIAFLIIFWFAGDALIGSFLHEGSEDLDLLATFNHAKHYLRIMMIQMLPFAVMQVYSSSLKETGETLLPMKASLIAVGVNLVGNYILIFGKFGAPELGVEGAAIATVIARFVECAILIIYSHTKKERFPFFEKLYRSFKIPIPLFKEIAKKGIPLLLNELLWSAGMTTLNQCYSVRGLEVVSALNISSTVTNLFFCANMAVGTTITIVVGQQLGGGKLEEAVKSSKKLTVLSFLMNVGLGIVLAACSGLFPMIYNTTDTVRALAAGFLLIVAIFLPFNSLTNSYYFTLRSGGKTIITFLFDSAFIWVCYVPLAFILSRFTALPIIPLYTIVTALEIAKAALGFIFVKSKKWVVNLVADKKPEI